MEESIMNRLQELEDRLDELEEEIPDTGLLVQSFIKRAFTVFGHNLSANLIVSIPLVLIFQYLIVKFMTNYY